MEKSDTRTRTLMSRFVQGMTARGFDAAYLEAFVEKQEPLFRKLAGANLRALYEGPPSYTRWRAALPAVFEGADPARISEALSVIEATRFVLFGHRQMEDPLGAIQTQAQEIRLPTAAAFSARLAELKESAADAEREAERVKLFETDEAVTPALVSARIRFLQRNFGVRLPNAALAAEKIPALDIDETARKGRTAAVRQLADLRLKQANRQDYLFAVAYCASLQPKQFPVFNRYVQTALCELREQAGFYPFRNENLRDYDSYLTVLSIFAESCGLVGTPLPALACYLEDLGRRLEAQSPKG